MTVFTSEVFRTYCWKVPRIGLFVRVFIEQSLVLIHRLSFRFIVKVLQNRNTYPPELAHDPFFHILPSSSTHIPLDRSLSTIYLAFSLSNEPQSCCLIVPRSLHVNKYEKALEQEKSKRKSSLLKGKEEEGMRSDESPDQQTTSPTTATKIASNNAKKSPSPSFRKRKLVCSVDLWQLTLFRARNDIYQSIISTIHPLCVFMILCLIHLFIYNGQLYSVFTSMTASYTVYICSSVLFYPMQLINQLFHCPNGIILR